jgi:hypothetical protein
MNSDTLAYDCTKFYNSDGANPDVWQRWKKFYNIDQRFISDLEMSNKKGAVSSPGIPGQTFSN